MKKFIYLVLQIIQIFSALVAILMIFTTYLDYKKFGIYDDFFITLIVIAIQVILPILYFTYNSIHLLKLTIMITKMINHIISTVYLLKLN